MSPAAVAMAVLLHGLAGLAIWWLSLDPPHPPPEEVIEVSIEQPKPPEPPPPQPQPQPTPQPAPQPQQVIPFEGLRPPADIVADKRTQAPPKGDQPKDALLAPPPPPLEDSLPSPDPQPSAPTAAELAKPEPPAPAPEPQKQALAPPARTGELPKPPEPAPKPPEQHALATPPPAAPKPPQPPAQPMPQLQKPEYKPSPLSTAPSRRPPAGTQSENPSPSPFVNPADTYSRARAADNYLWQVVRKLQGYRYQAHVQASQGLTVVRVTIARDGRLLNVTVTRSSGYPEFDNGVLAGVRSGSPYAPLPPDIRGDSASFDLPLVSVNRR
jgi:protein TonB